MAGTILTLYSNYPIGTNVGNPFTAGQILPDPTTQWSWNCDGYIFSHWNTQSDGSGVSYNVGTPASGYNLYAIWEEEDVDLITKKSNLKSIANAIRTKGGTSASLEYPAGFVSAISAISTGITPSGTISITANGTYNVTNYASANVNVSGGGGGGISADDIAQRTISGPISGNVSYISMYAFVDCKNITGASFPSAISIYGSAFLNCSALETISFPVLARLDAYAFRSCINLKAVNLPMVSVINAWAFGYCSKISYASLPMATNISTNAFVSCSSLANIYCPSVSTISGDAFGYCKKLVSADLPLVESIAGGAFSYCYSLNMVSCPKVKYIGQHAFRRCYHLVSVYLNNVSQIPTLSASAFLSTPIGGYTTSTDGVYGSVFVPSSLLTSFKAATNWASISARIVAG